MRIGSVPVRVQAAGEEGVKCSTRRWPKCTKS